jgi:hypothetical protein
MNETALGAIGAAIVFAVGVAVGGGAMHHYKGIELSDQKTTYEGQIAAANKAALAASERANEIQRTIGAAITEGVAEHTAKDENAKAQDARTISDLRNDVARLRVKTNHPVCSGELPGTAPGASAGNGEVETTLAPAVAARLAGRYADFNTVVRQLDLCQNIVLADRLRIP